MKSPLGTETVVEAATTMQTATIANCDEEKRLWGLKIARELDFTDEQYEEALKKINSPTDANQLLVALIEVSSTKQCMTTTNETTQMQPQQPFESSSSASSSCYSSITSFVSLSNASSSNQSLDSLAPHQHQSQQMNLATVTSNQIDNTYSLSPNQTISAISNSATQVDHLRKIYIDGSNVART